jgi:hypothetical protein
MMRSKMSPPLAADAPSAWKCAASDAGISLFNGIWIQISGIQIPNIGNTIPNYGTQIPLSRI